MAATVTVTGVVGPASALTAAVFTDVISFGIDTVNNILTLVQSSPSRTQQIAISAATTITATKSGSTYTLTIS